MHQLVRRTRSDIREWKRIIALLESGVMSMTWGGQNDESQARIIQLRRIVAENELLANQLDPDKAWGDDDVELGHVPPELVSQIYEGRPVSYTLDAEGKACDLKVFQDQRSASADVAAHAGRAYGEIGSESWSIKRGTP